MRKGIIGMRQYAARAAAAIALAFIASSAAAQAAPTQPAAPPPADTVAAGRQELPKGFRGYELGMDIEAVKEILKSDPLLAYAGDPDVSLLPLDKGSLIDVQGDTYIKRASFQFRGGVLWAMVFSLDPRLMDYFSVFTAMQAKYGQPGQISPAETVWEDGAVRISIERPVSVKYLDVAVLEELRAQAGIEKSLSEIRRAEFLKEF